MKRDYEDQSLNTGTVFSSEIKGFITVSETEIDVFLEFSWFFNDPMNVGNLIYGSSTFSKSSLNFWNFLVHGLAWRILNIILFVCEIHKYKCASKVLSHPGLRKCVGHTRILIKPLYFLTQVLSYDSRFYIIFWEANLYGGLLKVQPILSWAIKWFKSSVKLFLMAE